MKKILAATLLTLVATPASIFFSQPAKADTYCYPVTRAEVSQDAADHPGAYRDGYREGQQSYRNREAFRPRTAGGEFELGFEDGYYNRPYEGQRIVDRNRVDYYASEQCNTYSNYSVVPGRVFAPGRYWARPWVRW